MKISLTITGKAGTTRYVLKGNIETLRLGHWGNACRLAQELLTENRPDAELTGITLRVLRPRKAKKA